MSDPSANPSPSEPAANPAAEVPVQYPSLDPAVGPHPPLFTGAKKPRPPQTIRNITYSIGLITLVVIALFLFTKIGRAPEFDTNPVDVAAEAEQAQGQAPFTLAVPSVAADYFASSAEFSGGAEGVWSVYYAVSGGAINLVQAATLDDSFVTGAIGSVYEREDVTLSGVTCEKARSAGSSRSASKAEVWSLRCDAGGSALLVSGNVPFANVEAVTQAALASQAQ
ncbi:DUF4245 family protein [Micrococcales bacterium 31B]|nr:DUF4245 family protein [Micrococcales bacterium 31B]